MQIYLYFCSRFMQYLVFDDMTQCTEEAVKQLLPLVPDFRREQALKYKHTFGQFCCLKSWQMLLALLPSRLFAFSPSYNKFGKPSIEGMPEFSISHCKNAIAVAMNNTSIGIDVESIRRVEPSLIERTMNKEEQAMIRNATNPARAFTRLWTMKEAYLKYLGTGIVDDLHSCLKKAEKERFLTKEYSDYIFSIYC